MLGNFMSGRFARRIGINRMMLAGNVVARRPAWSRFALVRSAASMHPLSLFGPACFRRYRQRHDAAQRQCRHRQRQAASGRLRLGPWRRAADRRRRGACRSLAAALLSAADRPLPAAHASCCCRRSPASSPRRSRSCARARAVRAMIVMTGGIAGVILAGGRSTPHGRRRQAAAGRSADEPMLAHVLGRLAPQVGQIAINANGDPARFAGFGLPVLADTVAGFHGPLAGILAGLEWAQAAGCSASADRCRRHAVLSRRPGGAPDAAGTRPNASPLRRPAAGVHPVFALVAGHAGGGSARITSTRGGTRKVDRLPRTACTCQRSISR